MRRGRVDWSGILVGTPAVMIVLICCVLPLGWMVGMLILNPGARGEFSVDAFRAGLLGRTILYNFSAAVIATGMGVRAGFVLGRGRGLIARVLWVVLPAALIMPSLSYTYGWSQLVRMIRMTEWAREVGLTFRPNGGMDIFRCIWSLGTWLWAIPAVLIGLSLRRLDVSVQQQAALDGVLRRVTLRQLLGPMVAGMAIVTILATQEFSVYEPTGISVVATEVRMVFDKGSVSSPGNSIAAPGFLGAGLEAQDQPARAAAAVATATPLLLVTIGLAVIAAWGARRSNANDETPTAGDWPRVLDTSRWTVGVTVLMVLLNIGVPVVCLFASLRVNIFSAVTINQFGPQLWGALVVAGEAAMVALALALFSAGKWVPGMLAIAGATFLVGGQLLAIALIRIYNRPGLAWAYDISVVPVICYLGRFGWLAAAAGRGTVSKPWQQLRDMAAVDGATAMRSAVSVIWPLAWPVLVASGLLVGALSLTEVPATVLLMPQHPQVLTPTLMTWVHMARYDPMITASLLMMGTVLIPAVAGVLLAEVGFRLLRIGR